MRPIRLFALLLLGGAAFAPLATATTPVLAQEEGGEAPEQEGPKVEPAIKFSDRKGIVEVMLPKDWKSRKVDEAKHQLGSWYWPQGDGAIASVLLFAIPDSMRASLRRANIAGANTIVDGSVEIGDGWAQQRIQNEGGPLILHRYVESGGRVFVLQFQCHPNTWELCEPVATAAAASFAVKGEYDTKSVAADWKRKKVKDYVIVTNVDDDDVDEAAALIAPYVDMRKWAIKALGDPLVEGPWQVYVILQGSLYEKTALAHTGDKPDVGTYDMVERALLVKWMNRGSALFAQNIDRVAASQIVTEHFGGPAPYWVRLGLTAYVEYLYVDGGKPKKPEKKRMEGEVKPRVVGATKRLDQWFDVVGADVPDVQKARAELYGWHWFFRHAKQGKKWRKQYESYLEILQEKGDGEAAKAAFEGADFKAMREAFKKWGKSL